nr:spindle assembly checkpoint component MAD1-like isoform X1 [Pogona vitticeps]XP_020643198.1 spindle assembly checkpoint component MAD1-like isoform X1 [Pogona vitticeps]
MDILASIEIEYIKNLQRQVSLLECETSYLKEKAKKATSFQPKFTKEAEKMLQKMKELEIRINAAQIEMTKKTNSIKMFEAEIQAMQRRLQTLSDANAREKSLLMENATKQKKLADITTQDISHKETELLKVQQQVQHTINSVKENECDVHIWKMQLQQNIQQRQDMEQKLAENNSECLRLQAIFHHLEEKFLTNSQSSQQHIAKQLREEAGKLRQTLKEKQLSADEDKYLCNKMAEDCGHLTRQNCLLQAQLLEATRQLNRERQLQEKECTSHIQRVSELASARERERQLEMDLTCLKTLLERKKQKILKAQEQVFHLQQESRSVDQNGDLLQSQITDLEKRHAAVQLENSKLQKEKALLVEYISQLHTQIAEKDISLLRSQVNSLSCDLNNLKSQDDMASILQKEK